MGLMQRIFRARVAPPASPMPRSDVEDNSPIGMHIGGSIQSYGTSWAYSNRNITPDNALESPTFFACVKLASQTIPRGDNESGLPSYLHGLAPHQRAQGRANSFRGALGRRGRSLSCSRRNAGSWPIGMVRHCAITTGKAGDAHYG